MSDVIERLDTLTADEIAHEIDRLERLRRLALAVWRERQRQEQQDDGHRTRGDRAA